MMGSWPQLVFDGWFYSLLERDDMRLQVLIRPDLGIDVVALPSNFASQHVCMFISNATTC